MTDFLQIISSLKEQMSATLMRSDVLRALIWPIAILVFMIAVLVLQTQSAPKWMLIVLISFLGLFL